MDSFECHCGETFETHEDLVEHEMDNSALASAVEDLCAALARAGIIMENDNG